MAPPHANSWGRSDNVKTPFTSYLTADQDMHGYAVFVVYKLAQDLESSLVQSILEVPGSTYADNSNNQFTVQTSKRRWNYRLPPLQ